MTDESVAARYAKALFLVTEKRAQTPGALADLQGIAAAIAPDTRAGRFLRSPEIRLQDKRQALRSATAGKVAPIVAVFVDLLLRKKRFVELPAIARAFEALVERAQGVQRAHVVSAIPLPPAETSRLVRELERITNSRIKLTSEVDASLLGGALVRIGDRVIDRSVRTLLVAIERQLEEVSV